MTWTVVRFSIAGIKGVLDQGGELPFGTSKSPKSLAVFAPNACGKSGYADAVEYFFSRDGLVQHLGKGHADSEHGGKHALLHVLAKERGVTPFVAAEVFDAEGKKNVVITRNVITEIDDPAPAELLPLLSAAPAHRILRQHDLRRFVVDMEPGDKYAELSRWLNLDRPREILGHLKTAENTLKKTSPDKEFQERLRDLRLHTNGAVTTLDLDAVNAWCQTQAIRFLEGPLVVTSRADRVAITERLRAKRNSLITTAANMQRANARDEAMRSAGRLLEPHGQLAQAREAVADELRATSKLEKTASSATATAKQLASLWTAVERVLDTTALERCPVCQTPWVRTAASTQSDALMAVRESLVGITAYREAEEEVARTSTRSLAALVLLREGLSDLLGHCRTLHLSAATELVPLEEALGAWASRKLPTHQRERSLATLTTGLETLLRNRVLPDLEAVPLPGEPEAVAQIDDLVLHLSGLDQAMSRLVELLRLAREYRRVEEGFSTILDVIQKRAATMVNDVVKRLQSDVQRLYAMIHPDGTIPAIHIVPDTEARALLLRVDFHALGRTVPPAGYLSESQINTLGLALFLSAVRLFNSEFPFVFLDDIVSSYDAEHRSNIVNVIAEELGGFQVLLTTHDRMFFDMLRARLANKDWQFETIQGWALDEGPRRRTNLPQDQEIERLFKDKDRHQEAGNAVRRFMEEWLDRACAKYRAYTPHVREEKEYQRTLFDFWEPLMNRIDALQADFRTRVVNATSYKRLKVHALINFYSHHRPDPYMWGSMGDVIGVWGDFKEFTKLFNCSSCGNELRYDKDSGKVYCACGRGFLPQPDPPKEASS